ncbi:hypothetical protein ACFC1D_04935 [Streptomyces vinaceus]|uniref:hypothetical protein n=1 Tax=Streptomyces vinaceus TaxID=1960 RepID=UPI0035D55D2E
MAEAKRTIITQEVKKTEKVSAVALTITIEEAETLMAVLVKVAGSMIHSPRKHTDAILRSLESAAVRDWESTGHPFSLLATTQVLEFKNYKNPNVTFYGGGDSMNETHAVKSSREAGGDYRLWKAASRQYDFPVTVRRIGNEKQPAETINR